MGFDSENSWYYSILSLKLFKTNISIYVNKYGALLILHVGNIRSSYHFVLNHCPWLAIMKCYPIYLQIFISYLSLQSFLLCLLRFLYLCQKKEYYTLSEDHYTSTLSGVSGTVEKLRQHFQVICMNQDLSPTDDQTGLCSEDTFLLNRLMPSF